MKPIGFNVLDAMRQLPKLLRISDIRIKKTWITLNRHSDKSGKNRPTSDLIL